jgi:hypothetical protein
MSASRELGPEWVLSASFSSSGNSRVEITELIEAARRLWPGVQAHARKEQAEARFDDALALATEVWEGVLQSVAKTLERSNGNAVGVGVIKNVLHEHFILLQVILHNFQRRRLCGKSCIRFISPCPCQTETPLIFDQLIQELLAFGGAAALHQSSL